MLLRIAISFGLCDDRWSRQLRVAGYLGLFDVTLCLNLFRIGSLLDVLHVARLLMRNTRCFRLLSIT